MHRFSPNFITAFRFVIAWQLSLLAAAGDCQQKLVPGTADLVPSVSYLKRPVQPYANYANQAYVNYANHSWPYSASKQAFYGPMGNYITKGFDFYSWMETRKPEQIYGSAIYTDMGRMRGIMEHVISVRDGYNDWGYAAIVGDGLIARLSPLTLSKTDLNGVRLDLSTPSLQMTVLGSRIERTRYFWDGGNTATWSIEDTDFAAASTLLLGSRIQGSIGALRYGVNGANLHVYESTKNGNSLKGSLRPQQSPVDWVVVRVSDDSPAVGGAGATVQDIRLLVNGDPRPDITPGVIRHRDNATIQVGTISRLSGAFSPIYYNTFTGYYQNAPNFYRGRNEVPLYADYFYRLDHDRGIDVSSITNLQDLVATFQTTSPELVQHVRGMQQVIFLFDLSSEPDVRKVEVEAVLANDFRVEVATLTLENPRGRNYATQFRSTFYRTVLRAEGQIEDMSNLQRRRFPINEDTALFTYSMDLGLTLSGFELTGEYARSALYGRYPARTGGASDFNRGARSTRVGDAFFANAIKRFVGKRAIVGAELFSMDPDYGTQARMFLPFDTSMTSGPLAGLINQTVYWDLVTDNEDADRYPDSHMGNILGTPRDGQDKDADGVFIGQDSDKAGIPDTNRNFNDVPDYEAPFLMWDVEPNDYTYGLDRNNNDEPDHRENDDDPDYPYDADQQGYHLFAQLNLSQYWSAGAGRYAVSEVAGAGQNRSTYALLSYQREHPKYLRRIFFENHLRRVEDDISDDYAISDETARSLNLGTRGASLRIGAPWFSYNRRGDPLFYQDSFVNETYLEARLKPNDGLEFSQKVRLRVNWQHGGQLPSGAFQRKRRLDLWNVVSRVHYSWHLGALHIQPQLKIMSLRLQDREADQFLRDEYRIIPILRLHYPVMQRTLLRLGLQGAGPLPYRLEDKAQPRRSFQQRTAFLTLTNLSSYFGYDLYTIVGLHQDEKKFEDPFQTVGKRNSWSFFVRGLIGFTEHGPLL